jgi:hypothetical protein
MEVAMTDARTAVSAVFGAVNETALTVTTVVGTVSAGVSMLNNYIVKAKTQQEMRDALEMEDFELKLIKEAGLETARRQKEINRWLDANPDSKECYDAAVERYTTVLNNLKKKNDAEA